MDETLSAEEKYHILSEKISPKMTKLSTDVCPKYFLNSFVGEEIKRYAASRKSDKKTNVWHI
jgi:hypothetical protein